MTDPMVVINSGTTLSPFSTFSTVSSSTIWFDNHSISEDPNGSEDFTTTIPQQFPTSSSITTEELIDIRNSVRFWVQHILVPCVTVIGLFGNVVTVVVMCQRRMRTSSTHIYLAALALFDALYLVFTFLLSFKHYPSIRVELNSIKLLYWNSFPALIFGCDFASNTSIWLTVCFTIERYIVIRYPIKGKLLCTRSRAVKVILSVASLCFLITFPTFFEWTTVHVPLKLPSTNSTDSNQSPNNSDQNGEIFETYSSLGQNPLYRSIYSAMSVFGFVLIPLSILTVFNLFLIRSVRKSSQRRRHWIKESIINNHYYKHRHKMEFSIESSRNSTVIKTNHSHNKIPKTISSITLTKPTNSEPQGQYRVLLRQDAHITRLLIAVVIFFLVTQLPPASVLLYNAYQPETIGQQLSVSDESTTTTTINDTSYSNHSIIINNSSPPAPPNPSKSQLIQQTLGNVFNFLVAINAAGNFILYYLLSQKYRRTLADIGWSICARLFQLGRTTIDGSRSMMSSIKSSSNNRTSNKCSKTINNNNDKNNNSNKINLSMFVLKDSV